MQIQSNDKHAGNIRSFKADRINTYYSKCQKLAKQWRQQQPASRSAKGIVLIWNGSVYGWKDKLRNAEQERPEAIAVDPLGNLFIAQGGNDQTGAKHWVVVTH